MELGITERVACGAREKKNASPETGEANLFDGLSAQRLLKHSLQ